MEWTIDEFTKTEFTIGDYTFSIQPMPAIPAFNLGTRILNEAGKVGLGDVIFGGIRDGDHDIRANLRDVAYDEQAFLHNAVNGLLKVDPDFIEYLRVATFKWVKYRVANQPAQYDLDVSPEVAMQSVLDVAEVIVRCLVVFFIGSSQSRVHKLLRQLQSTNLSPPLESIPSSPES